MARHVSGAASAKCRALVLRLLQPCALPLRDFLLQVAQLGFVRMRQAARITQAPKSRASAIQSDAQHRIEHAEGRFAAAEGTPPHLDRCAQRLVYAVQALRTVSKRECHFLRPVKQCSMRPRHEALHAERRCYPSTAFSEGRFFRRGRQERAGARARAQKA